VGGGLTDGSRGGKRRIHSFLLLADYRGQRGNRGTEKGKKPTGHPAEKILLPFRSRTGKERDTGGPRSRLTWVAARSDNYWKRKEWEGGTEQSNELGLTIRINLLAFSDGRGGQLGAAVAPTADLGNKAGGPEGGTIVTSSFFDSGVWETPGGGRSENRSWNKRRESGYKSQPVDYFPLKCCLG